MFDAHFHLDFFSEQDIPNVVGAAQLEGIEGGVIAGVWTTDAQKLTQWARLVTSSQNSRSTLEFVRKGDFQKRSKNKFSLFATIGLHPWYQNSHWTNSDGSLNTAAMDHDFKLFENIVEENRDFVWAIGETGFDLFQTAGNEKKRKYDMQSVAFDFCIDLAAQKNLPLIVHTRNAWNVTLDRLFSKSRTTPALIHCYGGPAESFAAIASKNIFASFGGPTTWKKSEKLRSVVKRCPPEILMLETDAPDLPPEINGVRPPRNEPRMLAEIAKQVAAIRDVSIENICQQSDTNLFRWLGCE
jgi:TatD DNase family protein